MRTVLSGPGNSNNGLPFMEETRKNEAPDHASRPENNIHLKSPRNPLLTDGNNLKYAIRQAYFSVTT
jgi:hypothetical protein